MTHGSWIRRILGRSLLRERLHPRLRPIGECPQCGLPIQGVAEGWLDAERIVGEHLVACEEHQAVRLMRREATRGPVVLRPAL